jgi:hypothetical protein
MRCLNYHSLDNKNLDFLDFLDFGKSKFQTIIFNKGLLGEGTKDEYIKRFNMSFINSIY